MRVARFSLSQQVHRKRVAVERLLLWMGVGLAGAFAIAALRTVVAQRRAETIARQGEVSVLKEEVVPGGSFAGTYMERAEDAGPVHVMGQLRIPALDLTVPIISGIAEQDLARGAGHIPGSGSAGGLGNMAIAGHRDTFFRPLRRVRTGMVVFVSGSAGSYRYQVDRTEIVAPEQLKVLDIGDQPQLTMITCYPFDFIGAAPERFVVFAHLMSAAPDPQTR